jgi:hypothetical protein
MAIAKNPKRRISTAETHSDKIAEQFIAAAQPSASTDKEKLKPTPIRFSPELLDRIDVAARKRGLGRSSWVRYAASRVLDEDEG